MIRLIQQQKNSNNSLSLEDTSTSAESSDTMLPSSQIFPSVRETPSTTVVQNVSNSSTETNEYSLRYWEVPEPVIESYASKGVTTLFEWQVQCLKKPGVWEGKNLVYSAPTSGGKTLSNKVLLLFCSFFFFFFCSVLHFSFASFQFRKF